jgi:hypothetical protein
VGWKSGEGIFGSINGLPDKPDPSGLGEWKEGKNQFPSNKAIFFSYFPLFHEALRF